MINAVTAILLFLFLLPVLAGVLHPFSGSFRRSLFGAMDRLEQLAGMLLAFVLTGLVFSHSESALFTWVYALVLVLLLFVLPTILGLLAVPLRRLLHRPVCRLSERVTTMKSGFRRLLGGLWRLPAALLLVSAFTLLLQFYALYAKNAQLGDYIGQSAAYRLIDSAVLEPVLDSSPVRQVPVILRDSLEQAVEDTELTRLSGLIYVNGVSLEDAVHSSEEIDRSAAAVVGTETVPREKAALLYNWICQNITYDAEKAETVLTSAYGVPSGSVTAFSTGRGICFDYACLYVSMCRAAGLKVRLVLGEAPNGGAWQEHAWNQVWLPDEQIWLNVDTTFGSAGAGYFGNADFYADHGGRTILGEW